MNSDIESRLADRLKHLDPPQVPADLQDRLMADLPTAHAELSNRRLPRSVVVTTASLIAASLLITVFMRTPWRSHPGDTGTSSSNPDLATSNSLVGDVNVRSITTQEQAASRVVQYSLETDPCFILPSSAEL